MIGPKFETPFHLTVNGNPALARGGHPYLALVTPKFDFWVMLSQLVCTEKSKKVCISFK